LSLIPDELFFILDEQLIRIEELRDYGIMGFVDEWMIRMNGWLDGWMDRISE
jgi:hypothetical protein